MNDCFPLKTVKIKLGLLVSFIFLFVGSGHGFAFTSLNAIRSWTAPDHTRIVFDLDSSLLFQESNQKSPHEINFKLVECKNRTAQNIWQLESPIIKDIRLIDSSANSLIVKISLYKSTEYNIFYLREYKNKPHRIVIDIKNPSYELKEKETTSKINMLKRYNWIVVIDPGHGGEDPGATIKGRYKEKDVVLSVSKNLCNLLNKQPGIKAYLSREGDYFLSLRERIDLAHKYNADLFISVHANASSKMKKRGASVYYLSRDGATDEATALLAEMENASDKIGGIPLGRDKILDSILIDLAQTFTINESIDLGGKILDELTKIKSLNKEGLKCANFAVLKSPSMPSVLVELAYLTNPYDLKLLFSKDYQSMMAKMISGGVCNFFADRPPKELPEKTYAEISSNEQDYKIHIVKKGETLWRIATSYGIPLDTLRKCNGLDLVSTILVGQRLKIPSISY